MMNTVLDVAIGFTPAEIHGISTLTTEFARDVKRVEIRRDRVSGRVHVTLDAGWGTLDYWVNADGTGEHDAHL